ncbi:MAG: hypothetical protein J2P18_05340 [Nocardia sp.]|nr:hypothetical protein [Nocardia sp.]
MDDPANRQLIQDHFATLKNSADNVVSGARNIAGPVGDYHSATVSFGDTTANRINWLEAGITAAAVAGVALAIFTVGMSAEAAGASIAAAVTATTTAIEEAFTASTLAEILGVTTLTLGAVVTVKAFQAVPVDDLERDAAKLAAIIAMKVLIDDGSPGDDSERKQNPQGPGESPVWKDLKPYRGKTKTNGKNGKSREFYEWDYTHDDIEVYDSKGQHLGSMDPVSGKMYKPAVNGRKIPVG